MSGGRGSKTGLGGDLVVVSTGAANLAAVRACFERMGVELRLSPDPELILRAQWVVLPGVGAFGPARDRLAESGADEALRERVAADKPTLGICLGMHLLAEASQEADGVAGLGLIPGTAARFTGPVRVPQMGWNQIEAPEGARFLVDGEAYFANSFRLDVPPPESGWSGAISEHGGPFLAAAERGRILACQFHPELSGEYGAALVRRWYEEGAC